MSTEDIDPEATRGMIEEKIKQLGIKLRPFHDRASAKRIRHRLKEYET
jgi:hypothetical protein